MVDIPGHVLVVAMVSAKQAIVKANEALEPLDFLINNFEHHLEQLEALPRSTGRLSADMNSGLVEKIGELLRDYLKIELSTYDGGSKLSARGGLFYRIVKAVFEILEIPSEDPRRLVKNAVKNLSKK